MINNSQSVREKRIRKVTSFYYSRKDVQKAIYEFSKNREICPRYFEGFGKRPDSFQYVSDVFEMVKKGATSFNCSEELWNDPKEIRTGMSEEEYNDLRIGWDLVIDIDCKWFDYSKKAAQAIIDVFENHDIKNYGIKFSGSKGFHIILPWKSFPDEVGGRKTKDLFPELPRKIVSYIRFEAEKIMPELLPDDFYERFKREEIGKGIKCQACREIADEYRFISYFCPRCKRQEFKKLKKGFKEDFKCPDCKSDFEVDSKDVYICRNCGLDSDRNPHNFSRHFEVDLFELMGLDLVMVSPRHLFRAPYSLHEKTALASVVLSRESLESFELKDADPFKVEVKEFMPEAEKGESRELLIRALDMQELEEEEFSEDKSGEFKSIKITNLSYNHFPPSIKKILEGLADGKKRALFILINLFRSVGVDKEDLERRIYDWNRKNNPPLREGYIKAQLNWSYRNKIVPPPNFDKDYYKGIGVNPSPEEMEYKNPVNYIVKKNLSENKSLGKKKWKS